MDGNDWLLEMIRAEIVQRRQEGCRVTGIEEEIGDDTSIQRLRETWNRLQGMEPTPDFPYLEPSDMESIVEETGHPTRDLPIKWDELKDRIHAAWLGRCVGCLLGKPVEGWNKREIEEYLRSQGSYPLEDYIPPAEGPGRASPPEALRGNIHGMPRDDDTDYTILGLHMVERHGLGITSQQIGEEWLQNLPYRSVYTAERAAYRNLVNGLSVPETATHYNPYREWIGAQIRADIWGYVNPGNPEAAAEAAHEDARLSHVKNGVYGEMMVASMIAASFSLDDPLEVIRAGLDFIPRNSRLSEAVRRVLSWSAENDDWRDCWSLIETRYGHYHPVHTINNALNVVCSLLYGRDSFQRTVGIAVMCGWDTDCNGATSGSIYGAMNGLSGITDRWLSPLGDRVRSHVRGFQESRISELAERTYALVEEPG